MDSNELIKLMMDPDSGIDIEEVKEGLMDELLDVISELDNDHYPEVIKNALDFRYQILLSALNKISHMSEDKFH